MLLTCLFPLLMTSIVASTQISHRYYVVVDVHTTVQGARKTADNLCTKGYSANTKGASNNPLYYVYVYESTREDVANYVLQKFKKQDAFKNAWLLVDKPTVQ